MNSACASSRMGPPADAVLGHAGGGHTAGDEAYRAVVIGAVQRLEQDVFLQAEDASGGGHGADGAPEAGSVDAGMIPVPVHAGAHPHLVADGHGSQHIRARGRRFRHLGGSQHHRRQGRTGASLGGPVAVLHIKGIGGETVGHAGPQGGDLPAAGDQGAFPALEKTFGRAGGQAGQRRDRTGGQGAHAVQQAALCLMADRFGKIGIALPEDEIRKEVSGRRHHFAPWKKDLGSVSASAIP